jgi:hypothetical protein
LACDPVVIMSFLCFVSVMKGSSCVAMPTKLQRAAPIAYLACSRLAWSRRHIGRIFYRVQAISAFHSVCSVLQMFVDGPREHVGRVCQPFCRAALPLQRSWPPTCVLWGLWV